MDEFVEITEEMRQPIRDRLKEAIIAYIESYPEYHFQKLDTQISLRRLIEQLKGINDAVNDHNRRQLWYNMGLKVEYPSPGKILLTEANEKE